MEKRFGWLLKALSDVVGLFDTKGKAAITVFLIGCLIYLYLENKDLNRSLLDDNKTSFDRERDIYQNIIQRYDPQFKKMLESTDSMRVAVDSTTMTIRPVIEKLGKMLNNNKR